MRKICIISQKGGVGKTTTAIQLCAGLSRQDKRVLLIDLDPQGNVDSSLEGESYKDIYDLLTDTATIEECIVHLGKNFDAIKSKETLTKASTILANKENKHHILKEKLEQVKGYDYVVIDCPPSLGLLNQSALLYCSEAIIPGATDFLGLDGLRKMISAIQKMNETFEHDIQITKIVPTMYDMRLKTCKESMDEMKNEFFELVSEPIRTNSKLREAPKKKQSIFKYAPRSAGAKDYKQLVMSVINDEPKFASSESEKKAAEMEE